MLRVRVLLFFGGLVLALLAANLIWQAAAQTEDVNGRDSFGTRYYGWGALYETMQKLNLPVARRRLPPEAGADHNQIFVFWETPPRALAAEPEYIYRLREWVDRGGTVVLAPPRYGDNEAWYHGRTENLLLKILLDNKTRPQVFDTRQRPRGQPPPAAPADEAHSLTKDLDTYEKNAFELRDYQTYQLNGSNTLAALAGQVRAAALPRYLQALELAGTPHSVLIATRGRRKFLIGAEFLVGQGRVLVFSDPALIYNLYLSQPGNAALAVNLFACPGKTTVFDEFYHGHIAYQKAHQIFFTPPYLAVTLMLLVGAGLYAWHYGTRWGPALPAEEPTRRTVLEYIAAVSRLLRRGKTGSYVTREFFSGILWRLRHQLKVSPRHENIADLTTALAARSPELAARFSRAAETCAALAAAPRVNQRQTLAAMRELLAIRT